MKQRVISITRELGSGGNRVAAELAKRLNIPCYDNEIINKTAQDFGVNQEKLSKYDEKKSNSFLFSLATAKRDNMTISESQLNEIAHDDRAFMFVRETIKKLADEPCIIVGRCADFILRNRDIIKIFICADVKDRVASITDSLGLSEKNAMKLLQKTDKNRIAYYNAYADGKWGNASNYHITVNTSALGIDGSVDILQKFIEKYNEQ